MVLLLVLAPMVCGCGEDGDDDAGDDVADDDAGDDDDSADACGFLDSPTATLEVRQYRAGEEWTFNIAADTLESAMPPAHELVVAQRGCRYYVHDIDSCDPPCEMDEICTPCGGCEPYPVGLSAGTLTLTGLGDPIEIEHEGYAPGHYSALVQVPLAAVTPGAPVTAALSGGDYPAVTLEASVVQEVVTDYSMENSWTAPPGADAEITWEPGSEPGTCVELYLYTSNVGHGLPLHDVIHCIGPDTGSLVVPQAVLDAFPAVGLADHLRRHRLSSARAASHQPRHRRDRRRPGRADPVPGHGLQLAARLRGYPLAHGSWQRSTFAAVRLSSSWHSSTPSSSSTAASSNAPRRSDVVSSATSMDEAASRG